MKARARLLVFAGGLVGTVLRAGVGSPAPGRFPWQTLVVNLAGTLLLGFLVGRLDAGRLSPARLQFAGVGLMGSLTTFGTMAVQILDLAGSGHLGTAGIYTVTSIAAGATVGVVALRVGQEWS